MICLIVVASFGIFAFDQTKSASNRQTEAVAGRSSPSGGSSAASAHESSLHKDIDKASEKLTSPFSRLVSGSHSEWFSRGVKLLLTLVIYGFGLAYLARMMRIRV